MSWFKVGAALGGALLGGLLNKSSAKSQAQQNADLSRENWTYQQSNAHQLEVKDLRNAGLNPILSATNSQMAGMSPVSGQSTGQGELVNNAITSMLEMQNKKEMQKADLDIENKKLENDALRIKIEREEADAQIEKWKSEGKLNLATADYYSAKQGWEKNESQARVQQINQDIQNSISTTRALVEKYGAESEQARASAYNQLEQAAYAIELATGQRLSNQDFETFMKNPKRLLEKESFSRVNDDPLLRGLFMTAVYIKSLVGGVDSVSFGKSGFRFGSSSK